MSEQRDGDLHAVLAGPGPVAAPPLPRPRPRALGPPDVGGHGLALLEAGALLAAARQRPAPVAVGELVRALAPRAVALQLAGVARLRAVAGVAVAGVVAGGHGVVVAVVAGVLIVVLLIVLIVAVVVVVVLLLVAGVVVVQLAARGLRPRLLLPRRAVREREPRHLQLLGAAVVAARPRLGPDAAAQRGPGQVVTGEGRDGGLLLLAGVRRVPGLLRHVPRVHDRGLGPHRHHLLLLRGEELRGGRLGAEEEARLGPHVAFLLLFELVLAGAGLAEHAALDGDGGLLAPRAVLQHLHHLVVAHGAHCRLVDLH